jgi:hypothetical protein
MAEERCPECGAVWRDGVTCTDHFHQMLVWEFEVPEAGVVHHLTVLCYYLQHPSLYTPDGLTFGKSMLKAFVEDRVSPVEMRRRNRDIVASDKRGWKISNGEPGSHGQQIAWPVTIVDVAPLGLDRYAERVEAWARSVHQTLKALQRA